MADDAQQDLDEALPALEAATASLKNLSRNDVVEVKSLSNPPAGVKLVMEVRREYGLSFAPGLCFLGAQCYSGSCYVIKQKLHSLIVVVSCVGMLHHV